MIILLKELLFKIVKPLRKWYVKQVLLSRYEDDLELEYFMEKWIIKRIVDGQTARRKELAEKQARIKELQLMINFIKGK